MVLQGADSLFEPYGDRFGMLPGSARGGTGFCLTTLPSKKIRCDAMMMDWGDRHHLSACTFHRHTRLTFGLRWDAENETYTGIICSDRVALNAA
jgi:hypothetical protein